jgi:hypothetical protein
MPTGITGGKDVILRRKKSEDESLSQEAQKHIQSWKGGGSI